MLGRELRHVMSEAEVKSIQVLISRGLLVIESLKGFKNGRDVKRIWDRNCDRVGYNWMK